MPTPFDTLQEQFTELRRLYEAMLEQNRRLRAEVERLKAELEGK